MRNRKKWITWGWLSTFNKFVMGSDPIFAAIFISVSVAIALVAAVSVAAAPEGIGSWGALQEAVDQAENGEVIVLTGDLTAEESDNAIKIRAGKNVTVDLNGYTLDRNLTESGSTDAVIHIDAGAILTLKDSRDDSRTPAGKITGGQHKDGGGIRNYGTLIMEGGCVTGNTAQEYGGGIANKGSMILMGGSVTGNTSHVEGGGIYNYAKANLTIQGCDISGNTAPRHSDLLNEGTLTMAGTGPDEVRIKEMPVIRRFMTELAVIPIAVMLFALLLTVWLDAYLSRERKRVMVIIVVLVAGLMLQNYLEYRVSLLEGYHALRIPLGIWGYAVRPAILAMFLYIVKPDGRYRIVWAMIGVNAAVYMTAFFSHVAFYFDGKHFKSGPLRHTCTIVSAVLFAWLFFLTMRQFHPQTRKESWIPIFVTALIVGAVIMDFNVIFSEQPVSFLTGAIVISCVFYYIWLHLQFVQEHEEAMETGQRVQLSLSQIKPHFLYNALNTIEELCDEDPQTAKTAIEDFSQYLRANMEFIDQKGPIQFEKELEHTRIYLKIEKMRFEDALQIRYDVTCTDFYIPALTLEPLVENAIRHGIRKNKGGRGTVSIMTRQTADHFEVVITDDGPGFDPAKMPDDGKLHVGIGNVRERLWRVCGGTLKIESAPGRGTRATILLPKNQEAGTC